MVGRRAWTSLPRSVCRVVHRRLDDTYATHVLVTLGRRIRSERIAQVGVHGSSRLYALWSGPDRLSPSRYYRGARQLDCPSHSRPRRSDAVSKERGLTEKHEAAVGLLEEPTEAAFMDVEELRALVAEGRERGYLTFEEIAALPRGGRGHEGADLELHAHLVETASTSSPQDGRAAPRLIEAPPPARRTIAAPKKPEIDLTVEPSPRLAAAVPALDRARRPADRRPGGGARASASSAATWSPSSR